MDTWFNFPWGVCQDLDFWYPLPPSRRPTETPIMSWPKMLPPALKVSSEWLCCPLLRPCVLKAHSGLCLTGPKTLPLYLGREAALPTSSYPRVSHRGPYKNSSFRSSHCGSAGQEANIASMRMWIPSLVSLSGLRIWSFWSSRRGTVINESNQEP